MSAGRDPKHIAIVEDDAAVLNSLEFMFAAGGYRVSAYARAEDAEASEDIVTADCMIIDYTLPDLDGLTLLSRLRRRGMRAPAALITSLPSRQCREAASLAGVPVIEKPLNGDILDEWVRRVASA